MVKRLASLSTLLFFIISLTGCCTLMHGRTQKVSVTTKPEAASVKASNGQEFVTPGVLKLDRSLPSHTLHIEKEGYEPVEITLKRTLEGWIFGNFLTTGLLGIMVDFFTGSAYMVIPPKVDVTLEKEIE